MYTIQKRITNGMALMAEKRYRVLQRRWKRLSEIIDNATDYPRHARYEIRQLVDVTDEMARCRAIIEQRMEQYLEDGEV